MFNILKDNIHSLVVSLVFLLFLFSMLFPVEKFVSKVLKVRVPKIYVLFSFLLLILLVIAKITPLGLLISLPMVSFSFFVFLFGILSDRKYIYTMAFMSLALTPVMLILKIERLTEFFAQASYILLVLGVLKDIFYEKIFE